VRLIETHISYVLLTGEHAYKIKKAVNLEFLDFTTLAARRFYCDRELDLNRRLAPAMYLDVVAITGSPERPELGGSGPVLEYAVKMREFPQDQLLSRVLAKNELTRGRIDRLAVKVAAFHSEAARLPADSPFATADDILDLALQNFTQLDPLVADREGRKELDTLSRWTRLEHARRAGLFTARRHDGFVRECHGDLHLGNIALVDGEITIFDCIEFNDRMRWSDVMSDVAFLVMDLQDRGRLDLAAQFLNGYLELTGDYGGVQVLRFYGAYRAMVRAKVARLRASQSARPGESTAPTNEYRDYVELAKEYAGPGHAAVLCTHGYAGSGKTTLAQALVEATGGIRLRTDVERKRLYGLAAETRSGSALDAGLYSTEATERTYERLQTLARDILSGGYPVIVDGTFLRRRQRDLFRALAAELSIPFVIVDLMADVKTLRGRVTARRRQGADASEADEPVLEHQLRTAEPLDPDERSFTVRYDAEAPPAHAKDLEALSPILHRLGLKALA
jgi:hypothetical protein